MRVKSFPSLTAHWAALISVPLALSQTPAYTAKTANTGPVHRAVCPFTPRRLGWYQIILLGDRGTWVWTTCPELLPGSGPAGIELTTSRSWIRRPNHYATRPPTCILYFMNIHTFGNSFCWLLMFIMVSVVYNFLVGLSFFKKHYHFRSFGMLKLIFMFLWAYAWNKLIDWLIDWITKYSQLEYSNTRNSPIRDGVQGQVAGVLKWDRYNASSVRDLCYFVTSCAIRRVIGIATVPQHLH